MLAMWKRRLSQRLGRDWTMRSSAIETGEEYVQQEEEQRERRARHNPNPLISHFFLMRSDNWKFLLQS
jgi:hypothetical protein